VVDSSCFLFRNEYIHKRLAGAYYVRKENQVQSSVSLLPVRFVLMMSRRREFCSDLADLERYPSGQREQTVNLSADAFEGSNPSLSIIKSVRGSGFMVHSKKQRVRGTDFQS
jgi:hypothetical protein